MKQFSYILSALYLLSSVASVRGSASPFAQCRGDAVYQVTFFNFLTPKIFGGLIPSDGLVFSPLTVAGHSNRASILTVRGFASKEIEAVAETGDNSGLIQVLKDLSRRRHGVKSFASASGPTAPGQSTTLTVKVDCENPFISAVSMIAPSPDWMVLIANMNMFSSDLRTFTSQSSGFLTAYDAGTDDGRDFTPSDPSFDMPTNPQKNIAPLVEDDTDRFNGRTVGKYIVNRIA